jgi:hypothetical protein
MKAQAKQELGSKASLRMLRTHRLRCLGVQFRSAISISGCIPMTMRSRTPRKTSGGGELDVMHYAADRSGEV